MPALPLDAEGTLTQILSVATTAQSLNADLKRAFPQDFITIEWAASEDELVAAVGVPSERDCLVFVRHADGSIERVGFRSI